MGEIVSPSRLIRKRPPCQIPRHCYNSPLVFGDKTDMRRQESRRERSDKAEKFQTFNRPKVKVTRTSKSGLVYIDYKDTESLRKVMSGNGKILGRKRTGANAMEQRMIARAVKRARYMSLLPYVSASA